MDWVIENWDALLQIAGVLLTAASLITALTPTPRDDEWVWRLIAFFSFLKPDDSPGTLKMPLTQVKK